MALIGDGAAAFLGFALLLLTAFMRTREARYDRLAEWSFVAFATLAVPTILSAAGHLAGTGILVAALTTVGVASVVTLGTCEAGISLGRLQFQRVAPLVTAAFFAFVAWIGVASALMLLGGHLAAALGWLGGATIVAGGLVIAWMARDRGLLSGERPPAPSQVAGLLVVLAESLPGWVGSASASDPRARHAVSTW